MITQRYTGIAISLHWLIAIMILILFGVGYYMSGLTLSPTKLRLYSWHKWAGVTIFLLVLLRCLWRLTHGAPELPAATPQWQRQGEAEWGLRARAPHKLL